MREFSIRRYSLCVALLAVLGLAGCGGSGEDEAADATGNVSVSAARNVDALARSSYAVGGTLSGLAGGKSVILKNNGTDALTRRDNGAFTFPTGLSHGSNYRVTVSTQPSGQTCAVANGTGTIGWHNVSNIQVTCTTNTSTPSAPVYSVGGSVSGLDSGKTVVLRSGTDDLSVTASGGFSFPTKLATGANYSVTVLTQPADQQCTVENGAGTVGSADVTNVLVRCIDLQPPPVTIDKWRPGIYAKVEDQQLQSPTQMEKIYSELRNTPQLRGIKVVLLWGRYETRDPTTGVSTYNFRQIDEILDRLAALGNKHLILALAWREFDPDKGGLEIVPNDLRAGRWWSDPNGTAPDWSHTKYDYLWAYKLGLAPGKYGYNLKLWDQRLMSRIDAFLKALAEHVDNHPNFNHIATIESALGDPIIPFASGEGFAQQYAGQKAVIRSMRKHFVNSLVIPALNFDRPYVAEMAAILEAEGLGLGTPNSNKRRGLIVNDPDAPGVLTYFPKLSGKVTLAPEIQGLDFRSSTGDDSAKDYPSYDYLYRRVRDDLKANYIVIQRNSPFWEGGRLPDGSTTPSMLRFLQTYPAIVNDASGAGGLHTTRPTNLSARR